MEIDSRAQNHRKILWKSTPESQTAVKHHANQPTEPQTIVKHHENMSPEPQTTLNHNENLPPEPQIIVEHDEIDLQTPKPS